MLYFLFTFKSFTFHSLSGVWNSFFICRSMLFCLNATFKNKKSRRSLLKSGEPRRKVLWRILFGRCNILKKIVSHLWCWTHLIVCRFLNFWRLKESGAQKKIRNSQLQHNVFLCAKTARKRFLFNEAPNLYCNICRVLSRWRRFFKKKFAVISWIKKIIYLRQILEWKRRIHIRCRAI